MVKYKHNTKTHNTRAAENLIPMLFSILGKKPESVVDVGCGLGTWLKVFKDLGVEKICGYEGNHLNRNLLAVPEDVVVIQDLEKSIQTKEKFDLAISLEVAEHISIDSADIFVKSLVDLSDVVLFSAAIVGQGGQNHINEQEPNYWRKKFELHGYDCFDILREKIWDNPLIDHWYSQNIILYAKKGILPFTPTTNAPMYVHPVLYNQVLKQRNWLAKISGYSIWEKIKKAYRKEP